MSLVDKVNVFVGKIILDNGVKRVVEGEDKVRVTEGSNDFVDVLLDLEKENKLQHSDMVFVLWDLFISWAKFSIYNTQIGNHFIPVGTTTMVNIWAISHDQDVWVELEQFKPEHFLKYEDLPIMGSDLRLTPFSSGIKVCPRKATGLATVELWLAMFLQNFKWMPYDSGVDLSECLKLFVEINTLS
ncbi:hypothetical protein JHK87_033912 [Glycine soja]|nr:hypothetical protein JHK87_033912 [Glycine soja]